MPDLITSDPAGLCCPQGDFHIDPAQPVDRAIITHAHADHARPGHRLYVTSNEGKHVLRARLGEEVAIETIPYGEERRFGDVTVSLHPAGHVLGSAQVRVEQAGRVWVVSGDYKRGPTSTCAPFEPIKCDVFVTESTFGLPVYRWPQEAEVFSEVNDWWQRNKDAGQASILFAYALGKAQRLLAGVDASIGPIGCHGAVERMNAAYRATGIQLPQTIYTGDSGADRKSTVDWRGALIVAPPSAISSTWCRRFGKASTAFASGWMRIRGMRRRRAVDRGFVLSDHADWPGLLQTISETSARRVLVTHGTKAPLVRWLRETGFDATALDTGRFERLEEPS